MAIYYIFGCVKIFESAISFSLNLSLFIHPKDCNAKVTCSATIGR
jgi:hypothetical protein